MLEIHDLKNYLIRDRTGISKAQDFCQKLYTEEKTTILERSSLLCVTQHVQRITDTTKAKLEEDITIMEIENVLFKMKNNKARGPDGYSYEFFKNILGRDFLMKFLMLNSFTEYLSKQSLTEQQKTGIITC